jgi:hypothetical protein
VPRNIIFLDIDGVLAPIRDPWKFGEMELPCMQVLNDIVQQSEGEIVVTSSMRHGKTIEELQQLLDGAGFVGRVIDKTPTEPRGITRGDEITIWLAANPVTGYVILDDHADVGEHIGQLVQTRPAQGLLPIHVERALDALSRSPSALKGEGWAGGENPALSPTLDAGAVAP